MIDPSITDEQREAAINNLNEFFATFQEGWDQYSQARPADAKNSLAGAKSAFAKWREENRKLVSLVETVHLGDSETAVGSNAIALSKASDIAFGSERVAFAAAMGALDALYQQARDDAEESRQVAFRTTARSKMLAVLSVLFGGCFALGAGIFIAREMPTNPTQPLPPWENW